MTDDKAALDLADRPNGELVGLAPLMHLAHNGHDLTSIGTQLLKQAERNAGAMLDFSVVLQLLHHRDIALTVQAEALKIQKLYHQQAASGTTRLRVLVIKSPGDLMANTPIECLLEESDVALDILYVTPQMPWPTIPGHDVVFVAIGESGQNQQLLQELGNVLRTWDRPVLNWPEHVARLSRDSASQLLSAIPGIEMPITVRVERQMLERAGRSEEMPEAMAGIGFPMIVRPVDSHAGQDLSKLDTPADLSAYLQKVKAPELFVSRYLDYQNADGLYRKYRIAMIEGVPFLCHMAVSDHWMIHYLNAGMMESPEKRAEEVYAFASFEAEFAQRHRAALGALNETLGLDYFCIDCSEAPDGKLLIFEADTAMVVHAMDPVDLFPYKQPQMRKIFNAFRQMLGKAAQDSAA